MKPLAFPTAAYYIFPRIHHITLPGCLLAVLLPVITIRAADPDFGPNVFVLDPSMANVQEQVHAVFQQQERAQFGQGRHAFALKPGRYALDMPIGFFTHIAGLGKLPGEVTIEGEVWTDAAWMKHNAACTFRRTVENLTIEPPGGTNLWAVSQAAPLHRAHIKGDLHLSSAGWSSGGFMADCRGDGIVRAGSQQQWFSPNSAGREWQGLNWNMVFLGCLNAPEGDWPEKAVTRIDITPLVRERPYLTIENGHWFVRVRPLCRDGTSGLTWSEGAVKGRRFPSIDSISQRRASTPARPSTPPYRPAKISLSRPEFIRSTTPL